MSIQENNLLMTNEIQTKRICNNCKEPAIIWSKGKWWCSRINNIGIMNMKCPKCDSEMLIDGNTNETEEELNMINYNCPECDTNVSINMEGRS